MKKFSFFIPLIALFILLLQPEPVSAREATYELRSTTVYDYRCWASSLQMQNKQYSIAISCRDLIYPIEGGETVYLLWATPDDGSNAVKLGTLNYGTGSFKMTKSFDSLYVTTEVGPNVKLPQGRVVMRGSAESIDHLETVSTPTPTPESEETESDTSTTEEEDKELTTRERLVIGLKRAGMVSLLAFVALIGLIFVITRSRG